MLGRGEILMEISLSLLTVDGAYVTIRHLGLDSSSHPSPSSDFGGPQRFLRPVHGASKCDIGHERKVQEAYPGQSEITLDSYVWATGVIAYCLVTLSQVRRIPPSGSDTNPVLVSQ